MPSRLPTSDAAWRARLSPEWLAAAEFHFTELAVAHRASDWLVARAGAGAHTFADLGAGAGTFCLAAAERHPGYAWRGIELRPGLVAEAERWRDEYNLRNCDFAVGDITTAELPAYSGAYLFNPFGELLDPRPDLGQDLVRGTEAYRAACVGLRQNLLHTRPGFALVSYFTAGDEIPEAFERAWAAEDEKLVGWVRT